MVPVARVLGLTLVDEAGLPWLEEYDIESPRYLESDLRMAGYRMTRCSVAQNDKWRSSSKHRVAVLPSVSRCVSSTFVSPRQC
jgi:hypothetical protein